MADSFSVIAQRFVDAAVAALPVGRRPDRQFVAHGAPAWEATGADQVTVHVSPIDYTSLGNPRSPRPMQIVPVVTFTLQVVRCVPGIGDTDAVTLGDSAKALLDDFEAIQAAVTGAAGTVFGRVPVSWGLAVPLGPLGNVAGWSWPVTPTVS